SSRLVFAVLPAVAVVRHHGGNAACRGALESIDHQHQFHQGLIDGMASGLKHEYVGAAHVLLDLHGGLAVLEARDQSLAARHAKKSADLIGKRFVRRAAEDLELVIDAASLGLPFRLLVSAHLSLLFRRCGNSSHSWSLLSAHSPAAAFAS